MISKKEALLESLSRQPGAAKIKDVEGLLRAYGFVRRQTGRGHALWVRGSTTLALPASGLLARPYVRLVIRTIEAVQNED